VTVQHLLTHTSGLQRGGGGEEGEGRDAGGAAGGDVAEGSDGVTRAAESPVRVHVTCRPPPGLLSHIRTVDEEAGWEADACGRIELGG
jgi:hypothetical protein